MSEFALISLILLTLLGLAFYGFIAVLMHLSGYRFRKDPNLTLKANHSFNDDVLGASRVLNWLFRRKKLDAETYQKSRQLLEQEFGTAFELCNKLETESRQPTDWTGPDSVSPTAEEAEPTIVSATLVSAATPVATPVTAAAATADPQRQLPTAPWDIPDPPAPEPKRTFQEMLSGFMLDKNIRWGELASGILIVGSSVGLVVSLRNELKDTIPYFSALLFLLITAAIHGAGIYTFQKWKLRNTSRGALLIGLLLIPLNFLAACILSNEETQRRELTDPLLWIAIGVGLVSFSAMTWFSGKCLLRKGQLPLLLVTMGCAAGTLLINRAEGIDESTFVKLGLTVPLAIGFIAGTTCIFWKQWTRLRWPRRAVNRLFIFLGVSFFSFIAGAALLVIRAEHNPPTWVALAPSFSLVALIGSWIGHTVWKDATGKDSKSMSLAGLSLMIFGLIVVVVTWGISFANPTVLLVTSSILAIGFSIFGIHRSQPGMLIAAWTALGTLILCAVNLYVGELPWDSWTELPRLGRAAISGRSGISLLALGIGIIGVHRGLESRFKKHKRFMLVGWVSGGLAILAGMLLTVTASFRDRDDLFNNMAASGLLGIVAIAAVIGFLYTQSTADETEQSAASPAQSYGPLLAVASIPFAFLAHAFIWNVSLQQWLNNAAFSIDSNLTLILAAHALILSLVAVTGKHFFGPRPHSNDPTSKSNHSFFWMASIASVTGAAALIGCTFLINQQSGMATLITLAMTACCLLMAWAWQHVNDSNPWSREIPYVMAFGVIMAVIELGTRLSWCPMIDAPRHWLIQSMALSVWFAGWWALVWAAGKSEKYKFIQISRPVTVGIASVLALALIVLTGTTLVLESNVELIGAASPSFSVAGDQTWTLLAHLLMGMALLVAILKEPVGVLGAAIIAIWFSAWAAVGLSFSDQNAVATAMRWLLPVGGIIGAVLIALRRPAVPAWVLTRNRLALSGKSVWSKKTTQNLIDLALGITAIAVILLSTVAIVRVIMFGGVDALGGPLKGTLFGDMKKDISYGIPIGIIVHTFLLYAISERRTWLATLGSMVFQYCVILSVVLLFVSPHPKLASNWFINILQAVSLGMTGYGFIWWYFRDRVSNSVGDVPLSSTAVSPPKKRKIGQLRIHTLINGFLISSLAALVMVRFFRSPTVTGDWINSVGGPLGILALGIFVTLVCFVWKDEIFGKENQKARMWLLCWAGLALVGILAAIFDRTVATGADEKAYLPWITFNWIMWGSLAVCLALVVFVFFNPKRSDQPTNFLPLSSRLLGSQTLPILLAGLIVFLFALKGMESFTNFLNPFLAATALVGVLTVAGFLRFSGLLGFVSAGVACCTTLSLVANDPWDRFASQQPWDLNLMGIVLAVLAMAWSSFYPLKRAFAAEQPIRSRTFWMSNLVTVGIPCWLLLGSLAQWVIDHEFPTISCLNNSAGICLFCLSAALILVQLFNGARKGLVIAGCLWTFAVAIFVAVVVANGSIEQHFAAVMFSLGITVGLLGVLWSARHTWMAMLSRWNAPNLEKLESSLRHQLPIFAGFVVLVVLLTNIVASLNFDDRPSRYLTAFSTFGLAIGTGYLSDSLRRRWLQVHSLVLLTLAVIFVAWADLSPAEIHSNATELIARALLVLALAMFVYGGLVSRFVSRSETWLQSLRETVVFTCMAALICLVLVVAYEYRHFQPDVGCGMSFSQALAVALAVAGMAFGLIVIAVRPANDPFSLSLEQRTGYVYVAQLVGALLFMHLFFTMPFLFQIGIKEYWPYIVLAGCFAAVGFAAWLEKRKLPVLGQPTLNSAIALPLLVAIGIWNFESKADNALVTLIVGFAYLTISYVHRSLICGLAAIVFGNFALWQYYGRVEGFSFAEHPQLWLIPPAVSVLIAAQLSLRKLTAAQLALVRYICITTIYLSSTSEIFINGLGTQLWPPMVLALLSVAGIFAGIMLQVRAFLYLGAVSLLFAMVTMVSHAQQKLEHVWPWWAFGITLGIGILVMFGLFEKRKNDMRAVVDRLKTWDL